MKIRIKRTHGGGALFIFVLIVAVALGGCVVYKARKKARELEEKHRQHLKQEMEQDEEQAHLDQPNEIVQVNPVYNTQSGVNAGPAMNSTPPMAAAAIHRVANTNAWEDTYDESGF